MKNKAVRDIILIALLIGISVALLFLISPKENGKYVQISADGTVVGNYPLDNNQTVNVTEKFTVCIEGGRVYVLNSDCPSQLCVNQGAISMVNEAIVCLPNRIAVRIIGGEGGEPDFYL